MRIFCLFFFFFCVACATSQVTERKLATAGVEGVAGAAGSDGGQGGVDTPGFDCAISSDISKLKNCLANGMSVNFRLPTGATIFQRAVLSRNLNMLNAVVKNQDPTNRPDLRMLYRGTQTNSTGWNVYELILLERVMKKRFEGPIEVNEEELKDSLYVDSNQVERLKIVLEIEDNKLAMQNETRAILGYLRDSRLNTTKSVQEAIRILESATSN